MTNNEIKLLNMIHENDNPEQALFIAIEIIISCLMQSESSEEPSPVCSPVFV